MGDADKPFLIPHNILSSQGSEYFAKALDPSTFKEGRTGRLDVPDDGVEAWKVFLFWLFHRNLPYFGSGKNKTQRFKEIDLLVCCWSLGDKYDIPDFQDEVMLMLMECLAVNVVHPHTVNLAFNTSSPDSHMRRIMAEEVAENLREGHWHEEDFKELDGEGFTYEFAKALVDQEPVRSHDRLETQLDVNVFHYVWESYMVGDGPRKHPIVGDML